MTNETIFQSVLGRVYHEDNLLSQRTYNFLTAHAFLATALTVMIASKTTANQGIINLMPIFGLVLSFFHFAISSRNMRAIEYFRAYLTLIEKSLNIKVDRGLYEFYNSGIVISDFGIVGKEGYSQNSLSNSFPWNTRFLNSSLQIISIWMPLSVGLFWTITITLLGNSLWFALFPVIYIALVLFRIYQLGHLSSSKPIPLSVQPFRANELVMPLPELIDRMTIADLKVERIGDNECEKELNAYKYIYSFYNEIGVVVDKEIYDTLRNIHSQIWDLESDIRKGLDKLFSQEQIADRALRIRDLNKLRVEVKNKISVAYNFPLEIKRNHASE